MNPFFCTQCSRTSFLDERFQCIHCGNGFGPRTAVADNFNLPVPEPENANSVCHVAVTNAGNQKSEEYIELVVPTRETNTNRFEETSDFTLQIAGHIGYENCPETNGLSQNKTSHSFDQNNNENQNRLESNPNTNVGEYHDRFYDVCYPATMVEAVYDTPAVSQQTYLSEESAVSECENKNSSERDELLRRQRTNEPKERGIKSDSLLFMDSLTLESKYSAENLVSDSSEKVEDRQEKDNIRGNPSMNKCFQENSMTAISVAQQTHQTSNKLSKRRCKECRRYFWKLSTFIAHVKSNCNPRPFKCGQCDERFSFMPLLIEHGRVHTAEKPFKCTQCDYATKWPYLHKKHLETHR